MWVPSYSPKDFALALSDALDWRRMAVGAGLFLIVLNVVALFSANSVSIENVAATFDAGLGAMLSSGSFQRNLLILGGFALVHLLVAMPLIYMLMRGSATELCRGQRSSFPSLFAFAKHHVGSMILLEAIGFIYSAAALLPVLWAVLHLDQTGAMLILIIFGLLAMPVLPFLALQPILFAAHAVSAGPASEALFRSLFYMLKAPLRYHLNLVLKFICLGVLIVAIVALFHYAPPVVAWIIGLPLIGFGASYGTATDVLLYLKTRHAVDGAPYTLCADPEEEFLERASRMEQDMAIAMSGFAEPAEKD